MTKHVGLLASLLILAIRVAGAAEPPSTGARLLHFDNPNRIRDSYFVAFKNEADARAAMARSPNKALAVLSDVLPSTPANVEALSHALAGSVGARITLVVSRMPHLKGFSARMTEEQAKRLANDPRVKYIEANVLIEVTGSQTTGSARWHLDRIDQRDLPLNGAYKYDANALGYGTHAYIIDTGVRTTHSEFDVNSIWHFVQDCSIPNTDERCVTEFSGPCLDGVCIEDHKIWEDDPDAMDCFGHGTNIASLYGGLTRGVARLSHIHPVKFTDGCTKGGTPDSLLRALGYVAYYGGPSSIVVMAFVTSGSSTIDDAVSGLIDLGMTVVTGAGNAEADACNYSPARMSASSSVITVGAMNSSDARWVKSSSEGSNYGNCVTLFAPGQNVTGAGNASDTAVAAWDGTSQATPIVAGVAAILKTLDPLANNTEVKAGLLANVTNNTLTNIGANSPNKMLYSLVDGTDPNVPAPPAPGGSVPTPVFAAAVIVVPYLLM
jgi:subtilisin family serine protease